MAFERSNENGSIFGEIALAQKDSPKFIAAHIAWSVCLSVCRLWHSCVQLKLFDGIRCRLAGTLRVMNTWNYWLYIDMVVERVCIVRNPVLRGILLLFGVRVLAYVHVCLLF